MLWVPVTSHILLPSIQLRIFLLTLPLPVRDLNRSRKAKRRGRDLRPRLHEQIKSPFIAQILDPYDVTPDEFEQIKYGLFANVNAA